MVVLVFVRVGKIRILQSAGNFALVILDRFVRLTRPRGEDLKIFRQLGELSGLYAHEGTQFFSRQGS